jgi:hypothetical protein
LGVRGRGIVWRREIGWRREPCLLTRHRQGEDAREISRSLFTWAPLAGLTQMCERRERERREREVELTHRRVNLLLPPPVGSPAHVTALAACCCSVVLCSSTTHTCLPAAHEGLRKLIGGRLPLTLSKVKFIPLSFSPFLILLSCFLYWEA